MGITEVATKLSSSEAPCLHSKVGAQLVKNFSKDQKIFAVALPLPKSKKIKKIHQLSITSIPKAIERPQRYQIKAKTADSV